jgi:stearoyl-CoA desaturase (delta-9 desaturase)
MPRAADITPPPASRQPDDDVTLAEHENLNRAITAFVTIVPFLGLGIVAWQLWNRALHWPDLIAFAVTYVPFGFGVTVGFHRYLTHRGFETSRPMRGLLAILGSAAIEGPVIEWVANHRKHHAFSDEEGDPHSPHVGFGGGVRGALRGLAHAHVGWLFKPGVASYQRYAPDLMKDPLIRLIDETFVLWALLGLAFPFGLGVAITGSVFGGLTALLWGGAVRMVVLHHVTFSINSLCHFFGRRPFETDDESRNLAWLAPFTFGEAWHNNHHAFPTSATHGLKRSQFDPSAIVIRVLERMGLVWNVVRVTPERQAAKAAAAA